MSFSPSYQERLQHALISRPLQMASGGGSVQTIYVRPGGSDVTGDGITIATAYATLAHAFSVTQASLWENSSYVYDITGISEDVSSLLIPYIASTPQLYAYPPALLGVVAPCTIRAEMSVEVTVTPGDIVSITSDATTFFDMIDTTLALVPGALVGSLVQQFGIPFGTVYDNTATQIFTNCEGLSAANDIVISAPGATLSGGLTLRGGLPLFFEGIQITDGLSIGGSQNGALFIACSIVGGCLTQPCLSPDLFFFCFIDNGLSNEFGLSSAANFGACVFRAMRVRGRNPLDIIPQEIVVQFSHCNFQFCGPLFESNEPISIDAALQNCQFFLSTSDAIQIKGHGFFLASSCTFESTTGNDIYCEGILMLQLANIPASVTPAGGFGVDLLHGAIIKFFSPSVALNGAGGEVSIGNLGATTWAAVTAAAFARITDSGANGTNCSVWSQ